MIKTEDIPNLENSTFSTRVVKDIAQNILSFLKSNCTKEGHTYWLFKGRWLTCWCLISTVTSSGHTRWLFLIKNAHVFIYPASGSDIVKLYDLTTLCEEAAEEKCQNPFTLPVAVLLYKYVLHSLALVLSADWHIETLHWHILNHNIVVLHHKAFTRYW